MKIFTGGGYFAVLVRRCLGNARHLRGPLKGQLRGSNCAWRRFLWLSCAPVRSLLALACVAALGAACAAGASPQKVDRATFTPRQLASGFSEPVFVTGAKGEPGRLYVVEQDGRILVLQNGKRRATPLLDIRRLVTSGGEQGLLGLAFHPSYPKVRKLYVQYTANDGSTKLVEYRTNGSRASAPRQLFSSQDPYGNHNGGMLAFAPNGRLYFTMGDGGAGGDPENRAQNMRSLFGKLLSVNVATKGLKIEALGLRNAWRFSFDRANGDLYIGDVGQGDLEEIDYLPAASPGLENYGWDVYEGRSKFEDKPLGSGKLVMPVAQYSHDNGCSVTGGYVYRGSNASLRGRYIYGDYCSGLIWSFKIAGGKATGLRRERFKIDSVTSFGQDIAGELYAVSHGGTIYRLTP
jgi:glucose/arabinose dehydrogenase